MHAGPDCRNCALLIAEEERCAASSVSRAVLVRPARSIPIHAVRAHWWSGAPPRGHAQHITTPFRGALRCKQDWCGAGGVSPYTQCGHTGGPAHPPPPRAAHHVSLSRSASLQATGTVREEFTHTRSADAGGPVHPLRLRSKASSPPNERLASGANKAAHHAPKGRFAARGRTAAHHAQRTLRCNHAGPHIPLARWRRKEVEKPCD